MMVKKKKTVHPSQSDANSLFCCKFIYFNHSNSCWCCSSQSKHTRVLDGWLQICSLLLHLDWLTDTNCSRGIRFITSSTRTGSNQHVKGFLSIRSQIELTILRFIELLQTVSGRKDEPITRLLWFFLPSAINFRFRLLSTSVLYWALLFWFPLCRNTRLRQKGGEGKPDSLRTQWRSMQTTFGGWYIEEGDKPGRTQRSCRRRANTKLNSTTAQPATQTHAEYTQQTQAGAGRDQHATIPPHRSRC